MNSEKPAKKLLEQFGQFREISRNFNQDLLQIQAWETQKEQTSEGASGDSTQNPRDVCQATLDLSQEREARDAAFAKQVAEGIAREMAKAHMHYQALLNERGAAAMLTSLKMRIRFQGYGPL